MSAVAALGTLAALLPVLQPVFLAILSVLTPYLAVLISRAVGVNMTGQQLAALGTALDTAAQGMYAYFVRNKVSPQDPVAWSSAVQDAVSHVMSTQPGAVTSLGKTPDALAAEVSRRFGAVLAQDPNVTVLGPGFHRQSEIPHPPQTDAIVGIPITR